MNAANANTQKCELIVVSSFMASAIPARSAPILIVLATNSAPATTTSSGRGNLVWNVDASPRPVTIPMRAHIAWTATIRGQHATDVQSSVVPSWAPAIEYVAIPDGSSSAAPVTMPGPSDFQSPRSLFLADLVA